MLFKIIVGGGGGVTKIADYQNWWYIYSTYIKYFMKEIKRQIGVI